MTLYAILIIALTVGFFFLQTYLEKRKKEKAENILGDNADQRDANNDKEMQDVN